MMGLTVGSYHLGKRIPKLAKKIRLYAMLEIGIAVLAIIVYFLFNELVPIYRVFYQIANNNMLEYRLMQAVVLFALMVFPTFLMGATLPVLSAAMLNYNPSFTKTMGYLYGLNTLGAVVGVFLSGFFTLGSIGELNTILIGVAINIIAGTTVYLQVGKKEAIFKPVQAPQKSKNVTPVISAYSDKMRNLALIAYMVIGFTAFAMEVVWIRLFMLPLGTAIYSFSIVMTIYLAGSAIGSYIYGKYFVSLMALMETLGLLLLVIGVYGIVGIYIFSASVPWQLDTIVMVGPGKIMNAFLVIFPITFMLGFLFPLIAKIYVHNKEETGNRVGRLYASNTLGCIFGSLFCGYIFIPVIGTRGTILLLGAINVAMGIRILFAETKKYPAFSKAIITIVAVVSLAGLGAASPDPFLTVVNKGIKDVFHASIWYHKETTAATVTVCGTDMANRSTKQIFINGSSMTALVSETKVMSHLPLLLHPNPKNMLIICYGMGTALRSAVTHKDVNVDMVELVGEEFECGHFFHADAKEVLANKRVRHFAEDGRNFLLMNEKKYDVIVVDPAPPLWSAGTVNLYTREFFELCKSRLTDNGILCFWIPPDRGSEVKMIMKSYMTVFPEAIAYRGLQYAGFYMMGYSQHPYPPDIRRFDSAANDSGIMADLNEWEPVAPKTPATLLSLKVATSAQLNAFLQGATEVSDRYPYTEFPLWRKYNDPEFNAAMDANVLKSKE